MGFLTLVNDETFSKITISFWFRVPGATFASVKALWQTAEDLFEADETNTVPPPPGNSGIVPLFTFGKTAIQAHDYIGLPPEEVEFTETIATSHTNDFRWNCATCVFDFLGSGSAPIVEGRLFDPSFNGSVCDNSFLGVNVKGDTPVLDFRFGYDWIDGPPTTFKGFPEITSWSSSPDPLGSWVMDGAGCQTSPFCNPPGFFIDSGSYFVGDMEDTTINQGFSERTYLNIAQKPEAFVGQSKTPNGTSGCSVSADRWHHVLFALDIRPSGRSGHVEVLGSQVDQADLFNPAFFEGSVVNSAKVFLAFDDVNRTRLQISDCCGQTNAGAGPNDLITALANKVLNTFVQNNGTGPRSGVLGSGTTLAVAIDGVNRPDYDFNPPDFNLATINIPGNTDTTQLVEMADLQIFLGVALDTSDIANRRLFVTSTGKPEPAATAATALGTPAIALSGQTNWLAGTSTGSAGDLTPAGTIAKYDIDPTL